MNTHLSKNKKNNQGFTLVELLVAISIVGILSSMASEPLSQFSLKAKRSEATINTRNIADMVAANRIDNETGFTGAVSQNDFSSASSCNNGNDIGFVLTDCENVKFNYIVTSSAEDKTSVMAVEGTDSSGNKLFTSKGASVSPDTITYRRQQGLVYTKDAFKTDTCWQTDFFSELGSTGNNLFWDVDGDGDVDVLGDAFIVIANFFLFGAC